MDLSGDCGGREKCLGTGYILKPLEFADEPNVGVGMRGVNVPEDSGLDNSQTGAAIAQDGEGFGRSWF